MKRVLLLSLALLLTLMLLPTASIAAPGPKPKEWAKVEFIGHGITSEVTTLDIRRAGRLVIVYGPANLTFQVSMVGTDGTNFTKLSQEWAETYEDMPNYFGKLGLRIDKTTQKAGIIYGFGRYTEEDIDGIDERYVGLFKYQLEGSEIWSGESIPYGTITVDAGDFTIKQMFYTSMSKGKAKSATGVTFEEVWSGSLSFTITIT